MLVRGFSFFVDLLLINLTFLFTFYLRYQWPFPKKNFAAYKETFLFLTLIYLLSFTVTGVYQFHFKSSWQLFKKVFYGSTLGALLCIAFMYIFREKWGAFPTGILLLSYGFILLFVYKFHQLCLKRKKRIKKILVVLGDGRVDEIITKKAYIKRENIGRIRRLIDHPSVDEILLTEKIRNQADMDWLILVAQKFNAKILFTPALYFEMLPKRINGETAPSVLNTFLGRKSDLEEFFIRTLDILGSFLILLFSIPVFLLITVFIKITSKGPVLYHQERVAKDGKLFTMYKFRTMISEAEKHIGPVWAKKDDPRITKFGKILRSTRLDELPQVFNVLRGDMSLVGPRPERPHFVKIHRALQGFRLTVKPGITGLAQVRNGYDLHPKHKIKYDFLYVQRRSFLLNLVILLKTVPVVLLRKGQ